MGDHAVTRGEDVGQVGPHVPVDSDGAGDGRVWRRPTAASSVSGSDADHDEDHVDFPADRVRSASDGIDHQAADRRGGSADLVDRRPGQDLDAVVGELRWTRAPSSGSTVGSTSSSAPSG